MYVLYNRYPPISEVMAVIPALESVVADFQTASATSHLHKAALLLVYNIWMVYMTSSDCGCICRLWSIYNVILM